MSSLNEYGIIPHNQQYKEDDELTRLRAEVEALRADAERYRWLASRAHKETAYDRYGNGAFWRIGFAADDGRHALDAAIDTARAALNQEVKP